MSLISIVLLAVVSTSPDGGRTQVISPDSIYQTLLGTYLQYMGESDSALRFLQSVGATKLTLELLLSNNMPDSAIKIARRALSEKPDRDVWIYLIQAYFLKNQLDTVRNELDKLMEFAPNDPIVKAFAGRVYANIGEPEKAIKLLEEAVKQMPDSTSLLRALGLSFLLANEPDSAIFYLEKYDSTTASGSDPELLLALASAYEKKGDYQKAAQLYEYYMNMVGMADFGTALHLTNLYKLTGECDKAIQMAEELTKTFMFDPKLYSILATCYEQIGDLPKALRSAVTAVYLDPKNAKAHYTLARIAYEIGNTDMALKETKLAVKYDKHNEDYRLLEAMIYLLKEKPKKACRIAKKLKNNARAAWVCYYVNLNYRNDTLEALDWIEKAYKLSPEMSYGVTYALLLDDVGQREKADTLFEELIKRFPDSASVWVAYARHNYDTDVMAADSAYRRAAAIDSGNPVILNNWAYMLAKHNSRIDEADSLINLALAKDSTSHYFLDTKAWVLYRKGEYKEAARFEEMALQKNPDDAEYNEHMGFILQALGKNGEAIEYFEKALKLDPSRKYLRPIIEQLKKSARPDDGDRDNRDTRKR